MENSPPHPYDTEDLSESFGHIPPYSEYACPRCRSHTVESRNYATKAGCTIGALAGVGVSLTGTLRGARIGSSIGGPFGLIIGGIAGAVLDALASGAAGCATGITLGQIIDRTLLKNHKCYQCGHSFSDDS